MLNSLLEQNWEMVFEEDNDIVVEDAKGRKSRLHYSDKNLLTELKKPSGVSYDIGYDEEDRLNSIELPNKESFKFAYKDDLPGKLSINDTGLDISYNKKNQISSIGFPDNSRVALQYDVNGKLTAVTNRAGETQRYKTIIKDNKLVYELKDPLGRITLITMDTFGGVERINFPDGSFLQSTFDEEADAQVTRLRNGKTRTVYNGELFQERVEWGDGNFQELEFTDAQQIGAIENRSGKITYSYDASGRPLTESFQKYEAKYRYDADLLEAMAYPSGLEVEYTYTNDDQLRFIKIANKVVEYQYDPAGAVSAIRYPNGLVEEQRNLVFDGLRHARLMKQGRVIASQEYDYDVLGRLKGYRSSDQGSKKDWTFKYDNGDRLVLASEADSGSSERYVYDGKGNMVKAGDQDMLIGPMDEIRSIEGQALQYDGAGNLLGFRDKDRGPLQFAYADNSTLIQAQSRKDVWRYEYDGLGRRTLKTNGTETYRFFWAGDKMLVEELTLGGVLTRREYIYAESNVPIAFREKGELYILHKDVRGAITKVSDDSGDIVWSASYTTFGEAQVSIAKVRQPWRLNGQYFDDETGLHYNVARYYSPVLRSFLSLDPKWVLFGATNYSYAANDPYNKIDKNGEWPEWLNATNVVSVGAGIAASIATVLVIGAIAPAVVGIGATLLAVAAVGAISGAVGGLVESIVKDKMEGRDISWACAGKSALMGAAFGAVLGPVGKVLGKALNKMRPIILGAGSGKWGKMVYLPKKPTILQKARFRINKIRYRSLTPNLSKDAHWQELKQIAGKQFGSGANDPAADSLVWRLKEAREHFWKTYNEPLLDKAIKNGEKIRLFDDPYSVSNMYYSVASKTFMGREMAYLKRAGYTIVEDKGSWLLMPPIK